MMTIRGHIRETIRLSLPISIGFIFHMMLGLVDSAMIGKLVGPVHLAAASLVNNMFILILVLGIGMSVALTSLVAIARGEKNNDKCGILLRQSLLVNIVFSLFLFIAAYIASDYLSYLDQPPEVVVLASSYMKIISYSILPLMVFQTYRQFMDGLGETIPPTVVNFFANIVNAIGNWIFITGQFGLPRMELDGAGYSSLLTRIFIALVMMIYVVRAKKYKIYNPTLRYRSIDFKVIRKIISVGGPTAAQMFFEVGAFSVAAIMIGWIGANALAAHQIAIGLASLTFLTTIGFAAAGTIRAGNELGKKNYIELKRGAYTTLVMGVLLMAFFGLLFIIFKDQLPYIFVDDLEVVQIASSLLIITAFFQVFDGAQAVALGILRGIVDVNIPMLIAFISYWIISIPLSYYLGFVLNWGTVGVWISLSIGLIFAAVFFVFRIKRDFKKLLAGEEL